MGSASGTQARERPFRHCAVTGSSLEVLIDFYGNLGFTDVVATEVPNHVYIEALSGGAWESARIAKLSNSEGMLLEVIEPHFAENRRENKASLPWSHIALTVHCCNEVTAQIVKAGGMLVGGPIDNPDSLYRVAYVRDPYGNLLELVEPLPQSRLLRDCADDRSSTK